ncbi:MAG: sulfurtransferase [Lysobacteraceae bacterium]
MIASIAAYRFTPIEDPTALVEVLRERAEIGRLLGTVLVASEGINLFLAGEARAIDAWLHALRSDQRFADIEVKRSRSRSQPFARLKVKVKAEIISFRRQRSSPLEHRAPSVSPRTLSRWIADGHDDAGRRLVLLDTRNREEVDHGSFAGALRLPIDRFTELPQHLAAHREALADATVVSFCTGGIRCEKAALHMRSEGMPNVWQLDGGILNYFEQIGGAGFEGNCFVFDERIALTPQLVPIGEQQSEADSPIESQAA